MTTRGQIPLADNRPTGFTLQPGVYFVQNALSAGGRLVFDARGNENATWIIQCKQNLTFNANTTFELLNGAKAENIFWATETGTVGMNSSIVGTFVCRDNFTLQSGTMVTGRALASLGVVTMFGTTVTVPGFVPPPPSKGGADASPTKSIDGSNGTETAIRVDKSTGNDGTAPSATYGVGGGGPGTQAQCTWTVPLTNCGSPQPGVGWTVGTGTVTNGRLYRDGVASTCGGKAYPGLSGGTFNYDRYNFMNEASAAACVTVTITINNSPTYLHPSAYQGSFDPTNRGATYKGDTGSSPTNGVPTSFGFTIAAGQAFIIIIEEAYAGACTGANYTFTVSGSICPDVLPCAENFETVTPPALPVEKVETFTVQPKFEGNALDFGMVIPTPSQPKLHEMPRDRIDALVVVAEGVETREQIIKLTGLNCEYVQGYLLSRPIDGRAMRDLIRQIYDRGMNQEEGAA